MKIRPANIETDLSAIASICSAYERNRNILVEEVRSWLEYTCAGRIAQILVAEDESGAARGHVEISHEAWHAAGQFIVWEGVDSMYRGQKIGSALWDAAVDFLHGYPLTSLISSVRDDDPASLAFAQQRGFTIERHLFASYLDPCNFDETPYLPDITELEAHGICFCSLDDFPDTPETRQKYYELNSAIDRDMPGMDWDFTNYADFFEKHVLGSPWFRREGSLLAVDGESWLGFASVHFDPATCRASNATTGVIRSYRGRKIAQALKVHAVRYSRKLGAVQISTNNDSLNAPILAINQKMGYQAQAGQYKLVRQIKVVESL